MRRADGGRCHRAPGHRDQRACLTHVIWVSPRLGLGKHQDRPLPDLAAEWITRDYAAFHTLPPRLRTGGAQGQRAGVELVRTGVRRSLAFSPRRCANSSCRPVPPSSVSSTSLAKAAPSQRRPLPRLINAQVTRVSAETLLHRIPFNHQIDPHSCVIALARITLSAGKK